MNFIAIVWVFLGLSLSLSHTHTSLVFIRKDELCCNSFDCFRYFVWKFHNFIDEHQ